MSISSIEIGPPSTPSYTTIKVAEDCEDLSTCHWTCSRRRSSSTSWARWRSTSFGKTKASSRKRRNRCHRTNSSETFGCFSNIRSHRKQPELLQLCQFSLYFCPSLYFVWRHCPSLSITRCSIRQPTAPR